jgi:hypothetical protein
MHRKSTRNCKSASALVVLAATFALPAYCLGAQGSDGNSAQASDPGSQSDSAGQNGATSTGRQQGWRGNYGGHYSAPPRNWFLYNQPADGVSGNNNQMPGQSYGQPNPNNPNHPNNQSQRVGNQAYDRPPFRSAVQGSYAATGLVIPLVLITSLSSHGERKGTPVRASVSRGVALQGNGQIPAGSIVSGHVTESKGNGFLERGGSLSIIFDQLTLPDGRALAINAHLLGGLGAVGYGNLAYSDTHDSLSSRQRLENMGVSAEIGTVGGGAVGLAAAPVYGANFVRGLGSATSIVGAANVLGGMLRRGHNVIVPSGVQFQIQLDTPLRIGPFKDGQEIPPPPVEGSGSGF